MNPTISNNANTAFANGGIVAIDMPTPKEISAQSLVASINQAFKEFIAEMEKYKLPAIKEVIFNEESKTTILIWIDGKKTIVRCGDGETFDRYTGFMAAICKRMFGGTTTAKKLMNTLDKKYQAQLKAEAKEKEKAKRLAEMEAAKKKADKRRAKENDMLMEAMVEHFLMEAEAKKRAEEIMAARDTSSLKVPFEETTADVN